MNSWSESYLRQLERWAGIETPSLHDAWDHSLEIHARIVEAVKSEVPAELSLVAFGSLARMEFTAGSDLDWCLIVDGRADADHRQVQLRIENILRNVNGIREPNPAGAFAGLVFSHELIHCIGGNQDTNPNLTRRLLLLTESVELTETAIDSARNRLLRGILQRYFEEETRFPGKEFFPRFFLNDVVRFWRTMAVDFAAKTHERGPRSWALRNVKLRFSRKLLFVAGLLLCYETALFPSSDLPPRPMDQQEMLFDEEKPELSSTEHCYRACLLTPLELLARACIRLNIQGNATKDLFSAYDRFVCILADDRSRLELETLDFESAKKSRLFAEAREVSHVFQQALDQLYFEQETLKQLTLRYGVF